MEINIIQMIIEKWFIKEKLGIEYEFTSNNDNEYVVDGDKITYYLTIRNVGLVKSNVIEIQETIPSGLELVETNLVGGSEDDYNMCSEEDILYGIILEPGEEKTIEISTVVNDELLDTNQITIEFGLKIKYLETYNTDIISYKIVNTTNYTEEDDDTEDDIEDDINDNNNTENDNNNNNSVDNPSSNENPSEPNNNQNSSSDLEANSNESSEHSITQNQSSNSSSSNETPKKTYSISRKSLDR